MSVVKGDPTRRLNRQLRRTIANHQLFQAGDRVLVAVSGGKDSWTLLDLLETWRRGPLPIELVAVHLDQGQPGYDGAPLVAALQTRGVAFEILREDTHAVVVEKLTAGQTPCSLCSRLRRGILYSAAERLGANKIALGHHREDALETFLLNLLYAGRLQTLPPKYRTDDGRFEVVRPLVECAEADIRAHAAARAFPILPCGLCGSQEGLRREAMGTLLDQLEKSNPNVRAIMLNALGNVSPTHLMDRDLVRAWSARPADVRPALPAPERPRHARALPVLGSAAHDP